MSQCFVIVETNMFVGVKDSVSRECSIVILHLGIGFGIPFVLGEGEEICCCLPAHHIE